MNRLLPLEFRTSGGMFDVAADHHPAGGAGTSATDVSVSYGQLARTGRVLACNLLTAGGRRCATG